MKALAILAGLIASIQLTLAGESVPRLGILSDAGARKEADLLMVELQKAKCDLVERDEIGRVLREQGLTVAGLTDKDSLRLGQLLKADGLLLLSAPTNEVRTARLLAVAPGVVLWFAEFAAPDKPEPKRPPWTTLAASALEIYLPKLAVKPGAAVPVSLLRIRPAFDTASMGRLAADLNRLLLLRLLREPALFVLEREKLQQARIEADLTGQTTNFWTGTYVVDGVVRYDLAQTNQVAFSLSVRPPGDGQATEWVEAGSVSDLAQLVERAVAKLCAAVDAKDSAAPWDRQAEARRLALLAGGLVGPQERADALGSAMALGLQDANTAAAYRNALRAVAFRDASRFSGLRLTLAPAPGLEQQAHAFLEVFQFHNSYRPANGFGKAEEQSWLHGLSLADAALFFEKVVAAKRAAELGSLTQDIQTECQWLAKRLRAGDPEFNDYRRQQVYVRGARYFHSSTREILALYRAWASTRQTDPHHRVSRGIGEAWYLDRQMADPVFASAATEPTAERDQFWQEFIADLTKSEQPAVRINLAVMRLAKAQRGEAGVTARRALQETLVNEAAVFQPAPFNTDFTHLWSVAFPAFQVRNGRYETACLYRRNPQLEINYGSYEGPFDVFYDRYALVGRNLGAFESARLEDVETDAHNAVRLFLAITPKGQLREPDLKALVQPYLALLTEEEARAIYQLTLDYKPECPTCTAPKPVDAFVVQTWFGQRFPSLLDAAYRAEAARRQQAQRAPANALAVTRELRLPPCSGTDEPKFYSRRWMQGEFWACFGDDLVRLDPTQNRWELVPLPDRLNRRMFCSVSGIEVTDTHLLCWASKHETSAKFGLRPRAGGEWRFVEFPFEVRAATQIDKTIYLLSVVPRVTMAAATGLVSMDLETLERKTLRSSGVALVKPDSKAGEIPFEALPFEFDLQVQDGLLLESNGMRIRHGWNPKTNQVQPVKAGMRGFSEVDSSPYLKASKEFGFTLSPENGLILLCQNARFHLRVIRDGSTVPETVPLTFQNQPNLEKIDSRTEKAYFANPVSYYTDVILTPTSIFVPFFRNRGFWEIPYADIQQWLAANPPAADKPAPKAGGTAPVPSAPPK